ncbi:MAG: DNA repair protein RecN [Chloroflexi bacterium]|nr:DNA repair protein RecN [Chloroflexota bacterium]
MLTELRIRNLAIIESLELHFGPGLIVLTGETGAGKSIILDALEMLLGARADATIIRQGADFTLVEGVFRIDERVRPAIHAILEREGLLEDENYLTLGREVRREGRNIARVNGRSVNLGLLKELGSYLIDIHGQSEHLSLLNPRAHIQLLDRYADLEKPLQAYRQAYRNLQALRQELEELRRVQADAERRTEMLRFQLEEIEAARLKPGEDEELRRERNRLANAEALAESAQQALSLLDEGLPDAPSALDLLGQAGRLLERLAHLDPSQATLSQNLLTIEETLSDVARALRTYLENIEFNPRRLEQVEERLDLIQRLTRKYGGSIEAVLKRAGQIREELERIETVSERLEALQKQEASLLEELARQALALSQARERAAQALSQNIEAELNDLRMSQARFSVAFQTRPHPQGLPVRGEHLSFDSNGIDQVEFLIAPNPGEGFKPLVKIASGGETARLMLALKNVLARADEIPILVFDEIDQGIGGRVGLTVGQKLWSLARHHQVFCVTHLPQLAAFGDQHFRVQKIIQGERTYTRVEELEGEQRLLELSQMLGEIGEGTLRSAHELLQLAHSLRTPEQASRPSSS